MLPALQTTLPEPGLYMFPGLDESLPEPERTKAWEAKAKSGPRGLIIIDSSPTDQPAISSLQLVREGVSNVLAALIAALILTRLAGNFLARALAVSAMGLFGWISLMVSYWNWDRFPGEFITAELIAEVVGWFAAGIAMALIVPRPQMYHPVPA